MNWKYLILFSLLIHLKCKEDTSPLNDYQLGYHFYPMKLGDEWIYKTDSILYQKSNNVRRDTVSCYIREVVVDSSQDKQNNRTFRLEKYYRKEIQDPWELIGSSFVTISNTNVVKESFGLDLIVLVFPVLKYKSWNGTIRIQPDNQVKLNGELFMPFRYWNGNSFYYKNILTMQTIDNVPYLKIVEVEEVDYEDDINKILSKAIYAEDIGLVRREFWLLSTENFNTSIPWEDRAEYGAIITQTLIR